MKKKFKFGVGVVILLLTIGVIVGVEINRNSIRKQEVTKETRQSQEASAQQTKTEDDQIQKDEILQTENPDGTVMLRIMSSTIKTDVKIEGWFADVLMERLGIEVYCADPVNIYDEEYEEEFSKGVDLYNYYGDDQAYYNDVKEGKLIDMEDYIKKHPKVYSKYSKAIRHMKEDTYLHTGKKGVYGLPTSLKSFEDTGEDYECRCVSVPSGSKHTEEAMALLTYSASDEGIMNIVYGPEGQMWKKKQGKYILIKDWYKVRPGEKFVQTKEGKIDFFSAICPMELVANRSLGRELIR